MKSITIKKMLSCIAVICGIASAWMLTGCKGNNSADLVVYGKIFTAEGGQMAEAFAVKDGKYVYVGDKAGDMHFVLSTSWELDSWMDVDKALAKASDTKKYASEHIKPNWLKLFMDGTVESGTGFVEPLYPDGHQGIPNWSEEELTEITRKANAKDITMHVHVMGNKGVNRIVNAFVNGGKDEMRNTLVHVYNVNKEDYQRMADHNIYVTGGLLWHHATDELQAELMRILPEGLKDKAYPMKSYFDYGINVSSHSDFPALCGSPDDPFSIMEIVLTGVYYPEHAKPLWTEELLTREQALTALTINVAKQMFIENERGSISTGKYADFLLVDKDVLTCPVTEIHTAKPAATYFEGKKVFSQTVADESAYTPIDYSNETPLGDHAPVSAKFRYLPQ